MKRKKIYGLLLIFLLSTSPINITMAQSGWYEIAAVSSSSHLYGIYFKDNMTGITGSYRTTDSGQNWTNTFHSGFAMTFPDPNTGYIVGGGIFKTTNCGLNWIAQSRPTPSMLFGISFSGVNDGYACGEYAVITKTINGGTNWILVGSLISDSYFLTGVYVTDVNNVYICGCLGESFSSVILKSTNPGSNWSVQYFPAGTGYFSIFFVDSNTGIVIGQKAAKTTNAGITWVEKNQSVATFQHSLYFSSVNTGYSTGISGNIIKTTNGGETWFRQTSGTGSDLESVYFLNDYTGFVCGDNGVVLKTTDGGGPPIGITPVSREVPERYELYQNYPNPFNPVTKIKIDVQANVKSEKSNVKIVIYDILGKEIAVLADFDFSPGSYEVEWDASDYPSGVYFYSLTAGPVFRETKRMVLVK